MLFVVEIKLAAPGQALITSDGEAMFSSDQLLFNYITLILQGKEFMNMLLQFIKNIIPEVKIIINLSIVTVTEVWNVVDSSVLDKETLVGLLLFGLSYIFAGHWLPRNSPLSSLP